MRRHAEFVPWSREHHAALSLARSLREAGSPEAEARARLRLGDLRRVLLAHMEEEEKVLPERLRRLGAAELAERLLAEHAALREALKHPEAEGYPALGERLAAHVRFEERELFPFLEARGTDPR
ncbi:MAG: hemerythrin domain-containing protein [Gammaproteobacteria bacterium]|nr:hemerythrin domain-containing protein [Gammaproteobacteria bacterium]